MGEVSISPGKAEERKSIMKTFSEKAKAWERKELDRYLDGLDELDREEEIPYNDDYDQIIGEGEKWNYTRKE